MRDSAIIHAARWEALVEVENHGEVRSSSIRPREPVSDEYISILRTATRIYQLTRQSVSHAEEQYDHDIKKRVETDGRLIDPSIPVRFSGAITDLSAEIQKTEREINNLRRQIEELADAASFNGTSFYEEKARNALQHAKKIADIAELHPRTHLWMVWIVESLNQASEIHHLMEENHRFEDHDDQVFTYVAHPPLMVATLGCTATIEEVGVYYLNKFTQRSHDPDNTSSKEVLRDLKETYSRADSDEVDEIVDKVVKARNDLSHYISKRESAIPIDDIKQYMEICQNCVVLVGLLVRDMAGIRLSQFRKEILTE